MGYSRDAWGFDEYHPVAQNGSNLYGKDGIGFMIVDSLDVLIIMGLDEEYKTAREWVANVLDFNQNSYVSLFETTIRVLGGLLSAYHLSGEDHMYLTKATDLADRLLGAFNQSESVFPIKFVNLNSTSRRNYDGSCLADIGTLQLEFKYLSHLTGDPKYWNYVEKIMLRIDELEKFDGLARNYVSVSRATFSGALIGLGALGDSYYEYLLKQYLLTNKTEQMYLRMYNEAITGVKKHLLKRTNSSHLFYLGEFYYYNGGKKTRFVPRMEHLTCFAGALFALGSEKIHDSFSEENLIIGKKLTHTCCEMYFTQATGLAPEYVLYNTNSTGDTLYDNGRKHNVLRPETVESLFLLWRVTGDIQYRQVEFLYLLTFKEWGWRIFQSFENYSRFPEGGYTEIVDVDAIPPKRTDNMPTFWLAETLKYLYLLFEDPDNDLLSLDKYVFNTEAHPLPIFVPSEEIRGEGWNRQ
ncbi:2442_t:CDS:2 [Ambispora leptoticha]|uniref:alpha-1,2-Mannosidase n=1 Tax=Ambispora leptoticha TaxID=144679 RepID=A0A9N9CAE3_9GLOM|nr:2442_t:CDS:2 [Ambispora leptoticha]